MKTIDDVRTIDFEKELEIQQIEEILRDQASQEYVSALLIHIRQRYIRHCSGNEDG
jgi:hypothetical protein